MATWQGQTFTILRAGSDLLPLPEPKASITVRPFIGTSGSLDIQSAATVIRQWKFKVKVNDGTTIPNLINYLKPANITSGTIADATFGTIAAATLVDVGSYSRVSGWDFADLVFVAAL